MKIGKLVREFEPPVTELVTPQNEQERQAMITVAFQSLAKCGMYVTVCSMDYSPYQDGATIEMTFFTTDPFPHGLIDNFISPPHHKMFGK